LSDYLISIQNQKPLKVFPVGGISRRSLNFRVLAVVIPSNVIKAFITRERFEALVKNAYEDAAAFLARNETFLKAKVDALNLQVAG
jgi:hypothetical protein